MSESFYEDALARIHDVGFGHFAKQAAQFVLDTMSEVGLRDGLVVDLGCGSGICAGRLASAGYEVLGVDIAKGMLQLARRAVPHAKFVQRSIYDFTLPPCSAVICSGEIINYRAAGTNWNQRLKLFKSVHRALEPNGLFFLDFARPGRNGKQECVHKIFRGDDWVLFAESVEDRKRKRLRRDITGFVNAGRQQYRRFDETHELDLLDAQRVKQALRKVDFRVRPVKRYGPTEFPAGYAALVARKR